MRRIFFSLVAIVILAPSLMAAGGTLRVGTNSTYTTSTYQGYGPYQTGQGGEFTLTILTGDSGINWDRYVAGKGKITSIPGSFQTFCVEENQYIYPYSDGPANYTVSGAADSGGVAPRGGPDPISLGTAWLYSQFISGNLIGYDYDGVGRSKTAGSSADLLQRAIWGLENEMAVDMSNDFIEAVVGRFGSLSAAQAHSGGEFGIKVLNITKNDGQRQDQLIAVPDGGLTAILLAMSLGTLAMISRRQNAPSRR